MNVYACLAAAVLLVCSGCGGSSGLPPAATPASAVGAGADMAPHPAARMEPQPVEPAGRSLEFDESMEEDQAYPPSEPWLDDEPNADEADDADWEDDEPDDAFEEEEGEDDYADQADWG